MITWPPSQADRLAAKAMYSACLAQSMPKMRAFAALANADFESNCNPNAKGDYYIDGVLQHWSANPTGTPSAFGLFQRQKIRLDIIKNGNGKIEGLGIDIYSAVMADANTVENDVKAMMWELNQFPEYGYVQMQAAKTARDAAVAMCTFFERASTSASDRGARAEQWVVLAQESHW